MLHKTALILKTVRMFWDFYSRGSTIGEIAKRIGYSKSTVRRMMTKLVEWGYVTHEKADYKSTGKNVYTITAAGIEWVSDYRSMF